MKLLNMWSITSFQMFEIKSSDIAESRSNGNNKNSLKDKINQAFSKSRSQSHDQEEDLYSVSYKGIASDFTSKNMPSKPARTSSSSLPKCITKHVLFQSSMDSQHPTGLGKSIRSMSYETFDTHPASVASSSHSHSFSFDEFDDNEDEHPLHESINPLYSHNPSSKSLRFSNHISTIFNTYDEYDVFEDKDKPAGHLNVPSSALTELASQYINRAHDPIEFQQLSG